MDTWIGAAVILLALLGGAWLWNGVTGSTTTNGTNATDSTSGSSDSESDLDTASPEPTLGPLTMRVSSGSTCVEAAGCDVPITITNTSSQATETLADLYARLSNGQVFAGENDDLWLTDLNPNVSNTFYFSFPDMPMGVTITEFFLADSADSPPESSVMGSWRTVELDGLK